MFVLLVSLAFVADLTIFLVTAHPINNQGVCEDIKVQSCQTVLPYHQTILPNSIGHHRQSLIARSISAYIHPKGQKCSADLEFFVCAYHLPMCFDGYPEIKVCRSLCEKVKRQCNNTMHAHKRPWPEFVRCEDLPSKETDVCIDPSSVSGHGEQEKVNRTDTACQCSRKQNLTEEVFKNGSFDYVLKVQVNALNRVPNGTAVSVRVLRVFRHGHVRRLQRGLLTLWEAGCGCHGFQIFKEYLVCAHEDPTLSRLLPVDRVEVWKPFWRVKMKEWVSRMKQAITST